MWAIEILLPAGLDMHVKSSEEEVRKIFKEKVFELIERFNDLECKEYDDYLEIHNLIALGNYKEAQDCFNDINEYNEEFDTYIYMYSLKADDDFDPYDYH